jgi:hypothetical protein
VVATVRADQILAEQGNNMDVTAMRLRERVRRLMRTAAVGTAVMVISGLCLTGAAQAAPGLHVPGTALGAVATVGSRSSAASTSKECFYTTPDCSSSDPSVSFNISSIGDTSACTFTTTAAWGDAKSTTQTYNGGANGAVLATFKHTYADVAATYKVTVTNKTPTGGCSDFGTAIVHFMLTAPSCASLSDPGALATATCSPCPKPAAGPATVSGAGQARGVTMPARPHPRRGVPDTARPDHLSLIWSGYAQAGAQTDHFTGVVSEWSVPAVDIKVSGTQAVSDWVGIDGDRNNKKLVQAGTESETIDGKAEYSAWVETIPEPEARVKELVIHPGDKMIVYVVETAAGKWDMLLLDESTGKRFGCTVDYTTPEQDAEAIHERPTIDGRISTLAKTGDVSFGITEVATGAPGSQHWDPIGTSFHGDKLEQIFMEDHDGGAIIASPSQLANDACFSVAYGDKAPPLPPPCL